MISQIGKKKNRSNPCPGFTLIELVLVILLLSILMALSVPLFRNTFRDLEFKNTSLNIAKLIDYTREIAILERESYRLNLDFKKNKFWVTKLDTSLEKPVYKRITGRQGKIFSLPQGLTMSGNTGMINFYPDGRSDTGEIKLTSTTGQAKLIIVRGFGSETEIKEAKK